PDIQSPHHILAWPAQLVGPSNLDSLALSPLLSIALAAIFAPFIITTLFPARQSSVAVPRGRAATLEVARGQKRRWFLGQPQGLRPYRVALDLLDLHTVYFLFSGGSSCNSQRHPFPGKTSFSIRLRILRFAFRHNKLTAT